MARVDLPASLPAPTREELVEASEAASVEAFRLGMAISAALLALGGLLGLAIRNPPREVKSRECAGGQLAGVPHEVAQADRAEAAPARVRTREVYGRDPGAKESAFVQQARYRGATPIHNRRGSE